MRTCHRHYPGRSDGACSLVDLHHQRPSLCNSQVGSCNYFFGACSAFTHVMACTLAESPSDPLHRKLRQLRCLRCRFDCYRVERTSSRAGVSPAEVQRLSRRTVTTATQVHAFRREAVASDAAGSEFWYGESAYGVAATWRRSTDRGRLGCGECWRCYLCPLLGFRNHRQFSSFPGGKAAGHLG